MFKKKKAGQYQQKPKKPVDPNAPPRPTLLGHDKVMREMQGKLVTSENTVQQLNAEIDKLNRKVARLETTVNQLIGAIRRRYG